jgi:hypothetical protein
LQYTSGSTGNPKGVIVSHNNILSNLEMIAACTAAGESTVCVSWLPLFHDMGLLGTMLMPRYLGGTSVLMESGVFIQKPVRWLNAISRYRATGSAAPDSAYDLCVRQVSDEEKAHLDLSSCAPRTDAHFVDPESPEAMQALMNSIGVDSRRVVFLWGLDEVLPSSNPTGALLSLLQWLGGARSRNGARLWMVTRDAVEAGSEPQLSGLAQVTARGLARGVLTEYSVLFGSLIDLEWIDANRFDPAAEMEALLAEIVNGAGEDQVALRSDGRYVARLVPILPAPPLSRLKVDSAAAYLITGGFGALGLHTARWLAARGARTLILTGRQGPATDEARKAVDDLRRRGVTVRAQTCDIADAEAVRNLFDEVRTDEVPLRGIIHSAGIVGYKPLLQIDHAELEAVLHPKVTGAWLRQCHASPTVENRWFARSSPQPGTDTCPAP